MTLKGKGNYTGSIARNFVINPKGTTISKVTAASKGFTLAWTKQASQTTGYQIQYSKSKSFKNSNKTVTVKKAATTTKAVKNLTKKTTYYVRIRTYKTVNGKAYYSLWSVSKSVKTK